MHKPIINCESEEEVDALFDKVAAQYVKELSFNYMYQYIYFEEVRSNRKTYVFACKNRKSKEVLGVVKWFSGWRQYCFEPVPGTVFSSGCLVDIEDFVRQLMESRKS